MFITFMIYNSGNVEFEHEFLFDHCMQSCSLPFFDKLKEVKLVLQDCNRLESVLLKILEGSPNLECLILDREVSYTL